MKMRSPPRRCAPRAARSGIDASRARCAWPRWSACRLASISLSRPLELLAQQLLDHRQLDVEQGGERADIDDVLEQLALPRIGVFGIADRGERHADRGDVGAEPFRRQRPRRVVEQVAARLDAGDVLVPGLRVHRHHEVGAAARAEPALRRRRAPRTRSAVPGCWRGRCCAAPPARPCAGSISRTAGWHSPSPTR